MTPGDFFYKLFDGGKLQPDGDWYANHIQTWMLKVLKSYGFQNSFIDKAAIQSKFPDVFNKFGYIFREDLDVAGFRAISFGYCVYKGLIDAKPIQDVGNLDGEVDEADLHQLLKFMPNRTIAFILSCVFVETFVEGFMPKKAAAAREHAAFAVRAMNIMYAQESYADDNFQKIESLYKALMIEHFNNGLSS